MFLDYVDRLREEPVAVRRRAALYGAALFTSVIVVIWLSLLFAGRASSEQSADGTLSDAVDQSAVSEGKPVTPIEDISALFRDANTFTKE